MHAIAVELGVIEEVPEVTIDFVDNSDQSELLEIRERTQGLGQSLLVKVLCNDHVLLSGSSQRFRDNLLVHSSLSQSSFESSKKWCRLSAADATRIIVFIESLLTKCSCSLHFLKQLSPPSSVYTAGEHHGRPDDR